MNETQISMNDLFKKLDQLGPDEIVLDVRSADEFRSGHVPGSKNIPHEQVKSHAEELKRYAKIYVHCQAGKRAAMAVSELQKVGLSNLICIVASGMGDWIAAGYPTEK